MPRTTKTITFSLSPEMAKRVDEAMKQQGRSRSEFLREAVLRYIEECEWRQLLQYGEERVKEKGISPEDVADLVEEYRAEVSSSPNMKVVPDTNVIVSGLNFPGNERLVLELALRGRFELYLSTFILGGSRRGADPQVRLGRGTLFSGPQSALGNADTVIYPGRLPEVIEGGHADNRILECAVDASADYLVTGDRRHLLPLGKHQGTRIVNAPRFLSFLAAG